MPQSRSGSKVLLAGLMLAFPLLGPACGGEKSSTQDPPQVEMAVTLPETEAGVALAAALAEAGATQRHVFLHTGADW